MADFGGRRAGIIAPLFSCASTTSWGIGDFGDVPSVAVWLAGAGLSVWQMLPLNEMSAGQSSPYSALTAMALDPIYIAPAGIPDFAALGGEQSLAADERALLDDLRHSTRIDYARVRRLKFAVFRRAFERFLDVEWRQHTPRARDLAEFVTAQAWWIEDYAVFRALHAHFDEAPWTAWPEGLQRRTTSEIARVRRELATEVLFRQYLQWIAAGQWSAARAGSVGVAMFGDLPFMVDGDSADVWVRQGQFRFDVSIGAPPDAFNPEGQRWGMPLYRWDAMATEQFLWLRARARRTADLFDGFRVDHLVGFYRTYARPSDGGAAFFSPEDQDEQVALGEQVLGIFQASGAAVIAEDLGVVPDFVRSSLVHLGLPGFRVPRWEREWNVPGQPFRRPETYPPLSVTATGTHDTEAMAEWWERASADERRQALISIGGPEADVGAPFNPRLRDAFLDAYFGSASDTLLLAVQDIFGWRDRINTPGTVSDANWTWRLPWPSDRLGEHADAVERQDALRAWAARHDRF